LTEQEKTVQERCRFDKRERNSPTEHEFSSVELEAVTASAYRAAMIEPGFGCKLGADSDTTRELLRKALLKVAANGQYEIQTEPTSGLWQMRFNNGSIIRVSRDWRRPDDSQ